MSRIEASSVVKLPQADGTELHWSRVCFGQMVGTVHVALEVDTVTDAKHVSHLVGEHLG